MPTSSELSKLQNNCTWTWRVSGSTYGYTVTASNGNSIFLPAAGWMSISQGKLMCTGSTKCGEYLSSSPDIYSSYQVNYITFTSSSIGGASGSGSNGFSIRPVITLQLR